MINGFFDEFRFLSNFWYSEIEVGSISWPNGPRPDGRPLISYHSYATVEHAYQVMKLTNEEERRQVREATTPGRAKRVAYKMATFREDWDEVKVDIMRLLVTIKFSTHKDLAEMLVLTHPHELEETNHWGDVFWGVCDGVGENQLGKILMDVRDELMRKEG